MAVSLPVGSGKTVILSSLIPLIPNTLPSATRTLVLAHRDELLQQAIRALRLHSSKLTISLDQGRHKAGHSSDVVIASVNSLGRIGSKRLAEYDPSQFKAIIIDEAHHAAATGYRRILDHFKASKQHVVNSHIMVWGCSATLRRHDGLSLGVAFDEIVYSKSFEEMIEEGWLSDFRLVEAHTTTSLKEVLSRSQSDFVLEKLSRVVNIPERNKLIVDTYLHYKNLSSATPSMPSLSSSNNHTTPTTITPTTTTTDTSSTSCINLPSSPASQLPQSMRSTLVFAVDRDHIQKLVAAFQEQGVQAMGLASDTDDYDRRRLLALFQSGQLPVLVNCGILTEGVDIPEIDTILLARPTKSLGLLQQMVGRGLRKSPGKRECLVIDFVDTMPQHRGGIASVATLLGIPPEFVKSEKGLNQRFNSADRRHVTMGNASSSASSSPPPPRIPLKSNSGETMQLAEFKDIFDLQQLNRDARSLASISTLCWVRIGQGDFALSLPGNKLLLLKVSEEKTDSTSSSSFPSSSPSPSQPPQIWKSIIRTRKTRPKIPNQQQHANSSYSSYSVDQHVSDHDCLETAIRGWDAWVRRKFSHSIHHLTRRARWRSSKPSGAQLAIISRYISDEQKLESLNKGQAADITMRVMLGGLKQARRVEKLEAGGLRLKHQQYEKLRKQLLPSLNLTHQTNKS